MMKPAAGNDTSMLVAFPVLLTPCRGLLYLTFNVVVVQGST